MNNYIIVDLGTGNSRVALVSELGRIYGVRTYENRYYRDEAYEDAQYFLPQEWAENIFEGIKSLVLEYPDKKIRGITSSGARESIVLYDKEGKAFYGLPNIDNRGREYVKDIPDKEYIYERTGRWVTEDFPAAKLLGLRKKRPEMYDRISAVTSLSEWVGELLTGKLVIEPSQACETQLFDIESLSWSERICGYYGIDMQILPKIRKAGESIGQIKPGLNEILCLSEKAEFVVGGADTQMAVYGSSVETGDIGIVSGTTSPVVAIVESKFYDKEERCWTDCNLGGMTYQVETNPGVTGLNYQRMKAILFPHSSYSEIEAEMKKVKTYYSTASFSSLAFSQKRSLKQGGFVMRAPLDANASAANIMWSLVADIACSIYVQYRDLCKMVPHDKDYIIGSAGGFQSENLCQMIADLTGKKLILYKGYEQASINGGTKICNRYFNRAVLEEKEILKTFFPQADSLILNYYKDWENNRNALNP